jgi:hypothetical protein
MAHHVHRTGEPYPAVAGQVVGGGPYEHLDVPRLDHALKTLASKSCPVSVYGERGWIEARFDPSGEHASDRAATFFSGHECLHQGGGPAVHLSQCVRTPRDNQDNHRRAGREKLIKQVGLEARQP